MVPRRDQDDAGLGGDAYCLISSSAGIGGAPVGRRRQFRVQAPSLGGSLSANLCGMRRIRGTIRFIASAGRRFPSFALSLAREDGPRLGLLPPLGVVQEMRPMTVLFQQWVRVHR